MQQVSLHQSRSAGRLKIAARRAAILLAPGHAEVRDGIAASVLQSVSRERHLPEGQLLCKMALRAGRVCAQFKQPLRGVWGAGTRSRYGP